MIDDQKPRPPEIFIEAASLLQIQNKARVPGAGSEIDLRRLLGQNPGFAFRLMAIGSFDRDSGWRIVYAPLSISGTGEFDAPKSFNGTTFAAGVLTRGNYRFDSYRATYWRRMRGSERSHWRFGYTLKVRDAEIGLRQAGVRDRSRNTGIVPLLHVSGTYRLGANTDLLVDFDGLIAPQGSALDLGVFVRRQFGARVGGFLGVRGLYG
ncbi:hypothetical protein EON79_19130, partial [bacterium]